MKENSKGKPIHRILASGADGKSAGLVIPGLAKRGARVGGLLRKSDKADRIRKNGAPEIAIGDFNDPASLQAASRRATSSLPARY